MNLLSCLDTRNNSLFKHGLENDVPIGCHAHKILSQDLGGTWGLYAHSHSSAELFMGGCIVLLPLPCTMHCFRLRRHLSHEKKPPTFHYTGWLIGILIMVYYNP